MVVDNVSDALIRIKNSYLSGKPQARLGYSKLVLAICRVLVDEGFIDGFKEIEEVKNIKEIVVSLKYSSQKDFQNKKRPAITEVKRVSKPGLRVYSSNKNLPWVLNGLGIAIVSTPRGVMTDKDARKEGVGGEVLAYVW